MTHNFCESYNRCLTCTGTLCMCPGKDAADLRTPLRQSEGDEALEAACGAISRSPGHDIIDRRHNGPQSPGT